MKWPRLSLLLLLVIPVATSFAQWHNSIFPFSIQLDVVGESGRAPDVPRVIDWSTLPSDVRRFIHLSVDSLPPYPEPIDSLATVTLWPAKRTFGGVEFQLRFYVTQQDMVMNAWSADKLPAGWDYGACYGTEGPSWGWHADGQIAYMGYRHAGRFHYWRLDDSQRVYSFRFGSADSAGRIFVEGEEYFSREGTLVGFKHGSRSNEGSGGECYWMGAAVAAETFSRNLIELYWPHRSGPFPGMARPPREGESPAHR